MRNSTPGAEVPDEASKDALPPSDAEIVAVELQLSLEDSLDQIERLSAQLSELTNSFDDNEGFAAVQPPRPAPRRPRAEYPVSHISRSADVPAKSDTENAESAPDSAIAPHLLPTQPLPPLPRIGKPAPADQMFAAPAISSPPPVLPPTPTGENFEEHPDDDKPKKRRSRTLVVAGIAALLAIPAFALGAVQPWLNSHPDEEDRLSMANQDRQDNGVEMVPEPNPAVPNGNSPVAPGAGDAEKPSAEAPSPSRVSRGTHALKGQQSKSDTTIHRGHIAGLGVTVSASNVEPKAGEEVRFTVEWSDGEGQLAGLSYRWGDGSPGGDSTHTPPCSRNELNTGGNKELRHKFQQAGSYTVHITVTTYTCDGATEKQTVPLTLNVAAPPTTAPPPTSPPASSPPPSSPNPSTTPPARRD